MADSGAGLEQGRWLRCKFKLWRKGESRRGSQRCSQKTRGGRGGAEAVVSAADRRRPRRCRTRRWRCCGLSGLVSRAQATNSSTVDLLDPSVWRTVAGGRVHVDDAAMEALGEVSREETACVWGTGRRARVSGCGAMFCRSTGARRMTGTWPSRPRAAGRRPPPLCEQRRKERGRWAGPHCS